MAESFLRDDPLPLKCGEYKTDPFNKNSLFAIKTRTNKQETKVVNSWEQAYALHGKIRVDDINPAFITSLISNNYCTLTSPYKRIKRLKRSSIIQIYQDNIVETPYDPFKKSLDNNKNEDLYELIDDWFISFLRSKTKNIKSLKIGCEHSSGLDSNAILGGLIKGININKENIFTWSYINKSEEKLIISFRNFFKINNNNCMSFNKNSVQIKGQTRYLIDPLPELCDIFGFPSQTATNYLSSSFFKCSGTNLNFSGLGGDQAISNYGENVPIDLLLNLRIKDLIYWSGGYLPMFRNFKYKLNNFNNIFFSFISQNSLKDNVLITQLSKTGKELFLPYLKRTLPWESIKFNTINHSIKKRIQSSWISVRAEEESRLDKYNNSNRIYPFLEEDLIKLILNKDPLLFTSSINKGRLLSQKSFSKYLPPYLRKNSKKIREENIIDYIALEKESLICNYLNSDKWHEKIKLWWNCLNLNHLAEECIQNENISLRHLRATRKAYAKLEQLNYWLCTLS